MQEPIVDDTLDIAEELDGLGRGAVLNHDFLLNTRGGGSHRRLGRRPKSLPATITIFFDKGASRIHSTSLSRLGGGAEVLKSMF